MIATFKRIAPSLAAAFFTVACTPTLVAPYNADLQQKASSMQSEVVAWDITMRGNAGTLADDPRYPDLIAALNKWHGEASALLTLAISSAPGSAHCGEAVQAVSGAIMAAIPNDLRTAGSDPSVSGKANTGCEAELVAGIEAGIDDIEKALKYCKTPWVDDTYFVGLGQKGTVASNPPKAPDASSQEKLHNSCLAEFKVSDPSSHVRQNGRAVSALLTTLQAIVYIENRKKAAQASN